jgi:hypothetical protein
MAHVTNERQRHEHRNINNNVRFHSFQPLIGINYKNKYDPLSKHYFFVIWQILKLIINHIKEWVITKPFSKVQKIGISMMLNKI